MFNLNDLYNNYRETSPEELCSLLRSELRMYWGTDFDQAWQEFKRCIETTNEYTNMHQNKQDSTLPADGIFRRQSGEPYINHPLRVALILVHENLCTKDVLIAAIMHDLFEDTSYQYNDAQIEFGHDVAELILAVTNVSEKDKNNIQSGVSDEEQDYSDLIIKCNNKPIAYYIKFADRLDNLLTLDSMSEQSQYKKIQDTQNYLIPVLNKMGAKRFLSYIENAIFKAEQRLKSDDKPDYYLAISQQLAKLHAFKSTQQIRKTLQKCVEDKFAADLQFVEPTIKDIYDQLMIPDNDFSFEFKQSSFDYTIYIITDSFLHRDRVCSLFMSSTDLKNVAIIALFPKGFKFIDDNRNRYKVIILTRSEYNYELYGDLDKNIIISSPHSFYDEITRGTITVYTPKHDKITIAAGATVLDFAFKMHTDIGEHYAGAKINGKPVKIGTYPELHSGETIEIITGPNAEVSPRWMLCCKTEETKRTICRLLCNRITTLVETINKLTIK